MITRILLPILIHLVISGACLCQNPQIDSIRDLLKTAKVTDTLRIDYLNALSYEYADIRERELSIQNNSIALSEAENLAYIHGIAEALAIKSTVELFFNSDFPKVQLYAASSLSKFAETGNKKNIELSYFNLGFSYFAQGMFPEALQNFMASYEWQIKNKNTSEIYRVFAMIAAVHKENGNYEEFFSHIKKGYQLAIRTNNKELLSGTLFQMGEMYMKLEDYQKAVEYFREAFSMDTPELVLVRREWDVWVKLEYAETFSHLRMFDSAWHYLNHFKSIQNTETFKRVFPLSLGEWYFLQSNYVTALNHFEKGLNLNMANHDKNQIMRALINIARCHSALNNPELAKQFADKAIVAAQSSNSIQVLRDSYEIIYKLFEKKGATDSAAFYFRKYISKKDETLADQTRGKLIAFNYDLKLETASQQVQAQQQALKRESYLRNLLIGGIIIIIILGIVVVRNFSLKRRNEKHLRKIAENQFQIQALESEKTTAQLKKHALELEMQALRAQMNPHFIFNSLNSINRFILQNNRAQASEHLTKFSKLVRFILQNSQSEKIPLDSEIEALKLYLELEALRFDDHFTFSINIEENVDTGAIKVPPLIIQPYAENAIWHGLMHKEEKGLLEIKIYEDGKMLCFIIRDNGIGRKRAGEVKSKSASQHKSMGMKITADRIAILNGKEQVENIVIRDLEFPNGQPGGTEVLLKIPLEYD